MKETWSFIQENLIQKKRLFLLVVIDKQGSSPGQPGFKMAVAEDGKMKGSIGGGQTEYRLVEMARKELKKESSGIYLKREIHQSDAEEDKSGMICSGEQWVAFYPLDEGDLPLISGINKIIKSGDKGLLSFNQSGISFDKDGRLHHQHKNPVSSQDEWQYLEETGNEKSLYIFGAGHVGLALSSIMSHLDFTIHIFDDRKDLPTLLENTFTNHSKIIDYRNIGKLVQEDQNSYVVIMTFGHKSDEIVLRQLIDKNLKYLGMMGSSRKVAKIFENLRNDGFPEETIQSVFAPIGISIESQTPYEIAISIAAQLVTIKNKKLS